MGFRFRKSFGAGPFRVNLSKSGIGYSVGGKGFRFTKKAGGGTRTTASIPGTGISWVTDSKKGRKKKTSSANKKTAAKATLNTSTGQKADSTTRTVTPNYKKVSTVAWILAAIFFIATIQDFSIFGLLVTAFCALVGYVNRKYAKKEDEKAKEEETKQLLQEKESQNYVVIDADWIKRDNFGVRSYRLTRVKMEARDGSYRLNNLTECKVNDPLSFRFDAETDGYIALHEEYEIGELPRSANEACSCLPVDRMHGEIEEVNEADPEKVRVRVWFK